MEKQEDRIAQKSQAIFTQWQEILVRIAAAFMDSCLDPYPKFSIPPEIQKCGDKMVSNPDTVEATINIFANGLIAQGYIPTIDLELQSYNKQRAIEQRREATERSN